MLITMLKNNHIFVKNAVKIVKNNNINIFDKKAAWMIITMLKNSHILVKNTIEIVKNNNISAFNKRMSFILDK